MGVVESGQEPPHETIRLRVGCRCSYENAAATPAVIQVAPRRGEACEVLREEWDVTPVATLEPFTDLYGNRNQRTRMAEGSVDMRFDALVELPARADDVGEDAPQHP